MAGRSAREESMRVLWRHGGVQGDPGDWRRSLWRELWQALGRPGCGGRDDGDDGHKNGEFGGARRGGGSGDGLLASGCDKLDLSLGSWIGIRIRDLGNLCHA
ncbi:hypothetical protein M6B38_297060 [Iris pallida]|uniref:Uncharacterized protein n=1 Tax=Iris pallida TaxID=29817 RepID=A0AAX6HJY0_IRIPA|nr:hypothetical protein M6B38_384530 [Iris pallida]KAJ6841052.1 hypothetical protein M6B38_308800 [Iris pallida]KAJ6843593.1 hypothetical protein M6B38_297060 [Iris pallida]